jgi:hypothetical protein
MTHLQCHLVYHLGWFCGSLALPFVFRLAAFGALIVDVVGGDMLDFWCYSIKDSGGKIVGVKSGGASNGCGRFYRLSTSLPEFGLAVFPRRPL